MSGNHTQPLQKFPKSLRLLKHADFQAVYKEGRKHFSGNITVFYRRRTEGTGPRVGFTVGKVLGGAVQRNRIRRRMRAAVQRQLAGIVQPLDVIMHPRKTVLNMDFDRLDAEVKQVLAIIQRGKTK